MLACVASFIVVRGAGKIWARVQTVSVRCLVARPRGSGTRGLHHQRRLNATSLSAGMPLVFNILSHQLLIVSKGHQAIWGHRLRFHRFGWRIAVSRKTIQRVEL